MIEALTDAGVQNGLTAQDAKVLGSNPNRYRPNGLEQRQAPSPAETGSDLARRLDYRRRGSS